MRIKVLFFASARDAVGRSELTLELPERAAVESLAVRPEFEPLREQLPSIRFAVNEAFAPAGAILSDGDTVAVIPPVSGG